MAKIKARTAKRDPRKAARPAAKVRRLKPAAKLDEVGARVFVDGVAQPAGEMVQGIGATMPVMRAKFVVTSRQDVSDVVDGALIVRYRVTLDAAYEAEPVHNGLGTIQGNRDNRVFGLGSPDARLDMYFTSKAVADVFLAGRGFLVDFTEA